MKTPRNLAASQVLVLLLTASVVYPTHGAGTSVDMIVCEGKWGNIDCSPGTISIIDSQYGRSAPGSVACSHSSILNTTCVEDKVAYAKDQCHGQQTCGLQSSFSPDPCPGTYKYLNVTFSCGPSDPTSPAFTTEATTTTAAAATAAATRVVVDSKIEKECKNNQPSVNSGLRCSSGTEIVVTKGFCLGFDKCKDFSSSAFSSCPGSERTSVWNAYCSLQSQRNECDITCTGSCPGVDSAYIYAKYDCVRVGPVVPESTTESTTTVASTTAATTTTATTTAAAATTVASTTAATTAAATRVVVDSKIEKECRDDHPTVNRGSLRCSSGTEIVVTKGFCLGFDDCDDFTSSAFSSCPSSDRTSAWNGYCSRESQRNECDITCTGSCPEVDSAYFYAEYDCVRVGPVVLESTTVATTTSSTTPDPLTTSLQPTVSKTTTGPPPTTTLSASTVTTPIATTKDSSPEAVFEEYLAECFGNATAGKADVKPYRPLTFTSAGEDADSRLAVNFESASLQTKPVKLAIAAFSEPSQADGCGSVPEPPSNDTDDDDDVDKDPEPADPSRVLSSVVDVAVYCFNGAPLQLKDGEYVDVVFPAKIDFENEVPICTSMRGAASDWKWSTDGCKVVYSNYTHVTCRCDHLAAIALERGPKGFSVGYANTIALLLIEKILGAISVICLLVIVMVYFILGNQHSQLAKIQLNIAMSCCFAHLIYLVGMKATGNLYVCAAMAAVLQYLFTVYGLWLVIQTALFLNTCYIHGKTREGLHAALIAPKTFSLELLPLTRIFLAVWGLPVLMVGVLYSEYPFAYGTPESCWLVDTFIPYKIFISTTILGLLVNITLSIITAYFMIKIERKFHGDDEDYEEWTDKLKILAGWCLPTSVMLSLLLVIAWVLHVVFENWSSLVLDYMFHICIMSQGILVFVFYCVFNPQLRESHAKQQDFSDIKTSDEGTGKE